LAAQWGEHPIKGVAIFIFPAAFLDKNAANVRNKAETLGFAVSPRLNALPFKRGQTTPPDNDELQDEKRVIAAGFYFDKINHDLTPGAFDKTFIRGRQISFGDLQVDGWLFRSFVFCVHKPGGGHPVTGVQTFLLAGYFVVKIIPSAILATVESEFLYHGCFIHSDEVTTEDLDSGREQVKVTQSRPELNFAGTFALNFHNSLTHKCQRVVAGGGIDRQMLVFR
jgi:hypothetical protein